jgi:hypothetical protein
MMLTYLHDKFESAMAASKTRTQAGTTTLRIFTSNNANGVAAITAS